MELRQLRYLVRVVELGSISRAALDLDLAQSALSQQISQLESELSTRLLQRSSKGVTATEAGRHGSGTTGLRQFNRLARLARPDVPARRAGGREGAQYAGFHYLLRDRYELATVSRIVSKALRAAGLRYPPCR